MGSSDSVVSPETGAGVQLVELGQVGHSGRFQWLPILYLLPVLTTDFLHLPPHCARDPRVVFVFFDGWTFADGPLNFAAVAAE